MQTCSYILSNKKELVLNEYLTGGQAIELRRIMMRNQKLTDVDMETGKGTIENLEYTVDAQIKGLELLFVSYDGVKNIADAKKIIMELPSGVTDEILAHSDAIRNKKKEPPSEAS